MYNILDLYINWLYKFCIISLRLNFLLLKCLGKKEQPDHKEVEQKSKGEEVCKEADQNVDESKENE